MFHLCMIHVHLFFKILNIRVTETKSGKDLMKMFHLCLYNQLFALFHCVFKFFNTLKLEVRDGTPAGKRNRGRPMKRWRDALD